MCHVLFMTTAKTDRSPRAKKVAEPTKFRAGSRAGTGPSGRFAIGGRVTHLQFGHGEVLETDGDKLSIRRVSVSKKYH
jgi:hypothetical protein